MSQQSPPQSFQLWLDVIQQLFCKNHHPHWKMHVIGKRNGFSHCPISSFRHMNNLRLAYSSISFWFQSMLGSGQEGEKSPLSFNDQMRAIRAIALMLIWNSLAGHLPEGNQSPTTSGSTNYNTGEVIRVALHTDWQINARLGLREGNSMWLTARHQTSISDESWT